MQIQKQTLITLKEIVLPFPFVYNYLKYLKTS